MLAHAGHGLTRSPVPETRGRGSTGLIKPHLIGYGGGAPSRLPNVVSRKGRLFGSVRLVLGGFLKFSHDSSMTVEIAYLCYDVEIISHDALQYRSTVHEVPRPLPVSESTDLVETRKSS
jgi:hypothetical protein